MNAIRHRDTGTQELQAKRTFSVINQFTGECGDPAMSQNLLGRLCEQGFLAQGRDAQVKSRRMYDAGMAVLGIWSVVWPQRGASTLGQFCAARENLGTFDPELALADYKGIIKFFGPQRSNFLNAVINTVLHEELPVGGKMKKLRKGLNLIIEWQKQR